MHSHRRGSRSPGEALAEAAGRGGIERITTHAGLRLSFRDDAGVEEELRALVAVENACCSWALWEVSRADGIFLMDVSSTGDGIAVLHSIFA